MLVAIAGFRNVHGPGAAARSPARGPITDPVPPGQNNQSSIPPASDSRSPLSADPAPAPQAIPKELLEKRLDAARKVYQQNLTRLKGGQGLPSELYGWSERWLEAELALVDKKDDRAKALRDHLDRTREVERMVGDFAKVRQGRQADADAATYYRLEAEICLVKEGVEPHPATDEKGKPEKKKGAVEPHAEPDRGRSTGVERFRGFAGGISRLHATRVPMVTRRSHVGQG